MIRTWSYLGLLIALWLNTATHADPLAYLEPPCDPYYPGLSHPRLVTPQWAEEDVEAVVILSIDDMRDSAKYESFLRPLLTRLREIDGRAPVSIFSNEVDAEDPQLQAWLREGLSLETHTADHPCPLLCDGDLTKAKSTYERCVDQLFSVPNSRPVAFRMPCCDSLNTPSPRFWTEIFSQRTEAGNYLAIDSSVFNVFTADDPSIPPHLVTRANGTSRFRHYLPFKSFVNTIENYPYPYIIDGTCWEFPCVVPSDWEAQHVQQPNNPKTVEDWKRALDITVLKQGVMPIVFHPHGWIRAEQLAEFVDYADKTYGSKVKFLTFAEALRRLNQNLLGGASLRNEVGNHLRTRLVDVNLDGYMDVLRRDAKGLLTRVWNATQQRFDDFHQRAPRRDRRIGLLDGGICLVQRDPYTNAIELSRWNGKVWMLEEFLIRGVTDMDLRLAHFFLHDVDHDGESDLILSDTQKSAVLRRTKDGFEKRPIQVPVTFANAKLQRDISIRLVDLNADGWDDIVQASPAERRVWIYSKPQQAWVASTVGEPQLADTLPAVVAPDGTNNGAWFHSNHLWVQNEHTAHLPDLVERASFADLTQPKKTDSDHPLGKAKSLAESLTTFAVAGGGRLEVAAAEPQIADPVAFDWGANGELWVAEMGDYPNGASWHGPGDPQGTPGGRVKLLLDTDRDGRYETAHVFLDGLSVPTGVKAYRDGVLICVAPNILYAVDTDGDHVADQKEVLYEGLREGNQQHRANGLRWGLDHWIHVANGDSGGEVRSRKTNEVCNIRGRDFRIHPDSGKLELTSGQTQFGRSRDNQGNWFGGSNSEPVWHYVLDESYQARNPFVSSPDARHVTAKTPGAAPVFPTSTTLTRFNDFDRADRFTSACSTEVSRDDSSQMSYVYVCEPVHNLVHRSELTSEGVTFSSQRSEAERDQEFLTSSDNWFRPVMVRCGPDGSIWVADMYRQVIEHPEWIPMEWQRKIDHLSGNDKGRIYRVVFDSPEPDKRWTQIGKLSTTELVSALDTPNGVLRDLIQQELYERHDAQCVTPLKQLYVTTRWPAARIPIVWLLREFDELDEPFVSIAIKQNVADAHLLRASLPVLNASATLRNRFFAWLPQGLKTMGQRIQLAYLLGEVQDDRSAKWLSQLGRDQANDPFMRAAVMSSFDEQTVLTLFDDLAALNPPEDFSAGHLGLLRDATSLAVGTEHQAALAKVTPLLLGRPARDRLRLLQILREQLLRHGKAVDILAKDDLSKVFATASDAAKIVEDASIPLDERLAATAVLGFSPAPDQRTKDLKTLRSLLSPTHPTELQIEAVKLLRQLGEALSADQVFGHWSTLLPAIREAVVREALSDKAWTRSLLKAVEQGSVRPGDISPHHQARLRDNTDESIRAQVERLFQPPPSDREALVEDYLQRRPSQASLDDGRQAFMKHCSVCHRLAGQGKSIGPDLAALTDKSRPAMLRAILDPNRAVEDKYLSYSLLLHSGESYQGLLAQESTSSLTLATAEGERKEVFRGQIDVLQCTGKSLMPEGLEQVLPPKEMDNVIAYVQSVRAQRKHFPGNEPQLAPVRDDGSIRLFAMHAEIYGPDLVFEPKYRNLGFWHAELDRAVWTVQAKQAGRFSVNLDYACPPEHAGNRIEFRVQGQHISQEITSTGSWDRYRGKRIGSIQLPATPVQITISSSGPIDGYLLDLRTIVLWPE